MNVTCNQLKIVTGHGQMIISAHSVLTASGSADVEIRDMPILDQPAEGMCSLESLKLP